MTGARFTLSAFGDEAAEDLAAQLDVLERCGIRHLELRAAWGRNVVDLSKQDVRRARALLDERGFAVSAAASPVGKSSLEQSPGFELERLARALDAAAALGTRLVRVFSFYPRPGEDPAACRGEVLERLTALAALAASRGATLVLENEKGVYGDTPERVLDLIASVASPALRAAFDPANFVQVGVPVLERAWPLLAPHTVHVHVKDALAPDGRVVPAGEGDGGWPALLASLAAREYRGYLTLEPHLALAGAHGGFSGEAGMLAAAAALRRLLDGVPAEVD